MGALKQIFETMNIKIKNKKLEKEFFEYCENQKFTRDEIEAMAKVFVFYGDEFAEVFHIRDEERMGFDEDEVILEAFYCYNDHINFYFELPNSHRIEKALKIKLSTSEMSKQQYEKYISIVEAISKEVENKKMREEFLQLRDELQRLRENEKEKDEYIKKLVNIIKKITTDEVIDEIMAEKKEERELTVDEKRILKSIFEDDESDDDDC
jgi:hypothetical protein